MQILFKIEALNVQVKLVDMSLKANVLNFMRAVKANYLTVVYTRYFGQFI